METKLIARFLVVSVFYFAIFTSCKRDEINIGTFGTNLNPSDNPTASILDSGPIANDVRLMSLFIPNSLIEITNPVKETVISFANLNIAFHSDQDGMMPVGTYNFSDEAVDQAFIFHSSNIELLDSLIYPQMNQSVIGGYITVQQTDPEYVFDYKCLMSSGDSLIGSYHGKVDYADAY